GRRVDLGYPILEEGEVLTDLRSRGSHGEGKGGVFQGPAVGPDNAWPRGDARNAEEGLGDPVQGDQVGRVAHVVIRLQVQVVDGQLALREVPVRGRVSFDGLDAGGGAKPG